MNFFEQQRLVAAVAIAAKDGVKAALKTLKPSTSASIPRRFPPPFTHLLSPSTAKPVAVSARETVQTSKPRPSTIKAAPLRAPKYDFAHLVGMGAPAAKSLSTTAARAIPEPTRPSAPPLAALTRAQVALASQRGALASHTPRPAAQALEAAAGIVARQHTADAASAVERVRAAAVVAAQILAAGDFRGVRRP